MEEAFIQEVFFPLLNTRPNYLSKHSININNLSFGRSREVKGPHAFSTYRKELLIYI